MAGKLQIVSRAISSGVTVLDITGDLDVGLVIFNAAYSPIGAFLDVDVEDHVKAVGVNVLGTLRVSHYFGNRLAARGRGGLILMSSMSSFQGTAMVANYAATKAGMVGFSKSLAREIASRGITVNVVAPGFIDTDMTKDLPEDNRAAMLGQVPLGRLGEGSDIANAVLFLASAGGAYITGETLHVNGGMVMD